LLNIGELLPKCLPLNPYGIQPRYPREVTITEQEVYEAIKNAKAVYAFIQPLLAPETNPESPVEPIGRSSPPEANI
jgi:hypothetical protein